MNKHRGNKRLKRPQRHAPGYAALGFAILEQAVIDFKALCRDGAIVAGEKVVAPFPMDPPDSHGRVRPHRYLNEYDGPRPVVELVKFVKGSHCRTLLRELGASISHDSMMDGMGMTGGAHA